MARITYHQNKHSVIADGQKVEDFMDGESIVFAIDGQATTQTQGLDGVKNSRASMRPSNLTVTLKPTSPSLDFLQELADSSNHGVSRLINVSITTGVNDVLRLFNCFVDDTGFSTGGPTMSGRQFIFFAERYSRPNA